MHKLLDYIQLGQRFKAPTLAFRRVNVSTTGLPKKTVFLLVDLFLLIVTDEMRINPWRKILEPV